MYIPIDIQYEIINRLPVKSILQFRIVSKQWKSYIDSPEFIQLYGCRETDNCFFTLTYEQGFQSFMRSVDENFKFTTLTSNFTNSWYPDENHRLPRESIRIKKRPSQAVLGGFIYWVGAETFPTGDGDSLVMFGTFCVGDIILLCAWLLMVDGGSITSYGILFSIPTSHSVLLVGFTNNDMPIVEVDELGYQLTHTLQVYDPISEEFHAVGMEGDGGSFYIGPFKESLPLLNRPARSTLFVS
ncbi:F-box domain containing protein [Tanacetum coccineum]